MSAREKSDLPEVAEKRANKAVSAAAELVERRGGAKENAELQSTVRTQSREAVSQAQARIREAVNRNRQDKLTALLHHLTIDVLRASFFGLKKSAAPGVDEMTWTEYAEGLEENLSDLHSRVQTGAYRALPSRRTYIPKADGRQRPLGIAALEDKIVQAAVVAILTPIYEAEFLGFSYGFRPKRSQHQALDALAFGIGRRRINWVLDCDVQSFFDKVSQSWLIRFIEHRIGDRRIIRLIAKWLTAGVLEGGHLMVTEEGTPQGAVISPLLAPISISTTSTIYGPTSGGSDAPRATLLSCAMRTTPSSALSISTRQSGSLPISRQGSHASGSPFILTRRGSSSLADPQL
jgi:RNA-directed DNA polymerase